MSVRKQRLIVNYDRDHDVLYVSVGRPKPSYCDQDLDGILIRKSFQNDSFSGVTIMDFSKKTKEQLKKSVPLDVEDIYSYV